jgi:ParB family transcriptional regulator, chromosome partitioning protein
VAFDGDSQARLLAHCASLSVNAVHELWNRSTARLAHVDALARAVNLDMAAAGWRPTVDNYLSRVPKPRILEAVREARGEASAQLIDHLKKPEMAEEAERLLADTGWLPEPLRTTNAPIASGNGETDTSADALPAFLADAEDGNQGAPARRRSRMSHTGGAHEPPRIFRPSQPGFRAGLICVRGGPPSAPAGSRVRGPPERV